MKVISLSFALIFCLVSMQINAQNDTINIVDTLTVDSTVYLQKTDSLILATKNHIKTYNIADTGFNTFIDKYDKLYTRDLKLLMALV